MRINPDEVIKWIGICSLLVSLATKHYRIIRRFFPERKVRPCKQRNQRSTARQSTGSKKHSRRKS